MKHKHQHISILLILSFISIIVGCHPTKRLRFWEGYTDVFDVNGRVNDYQIEKNKPFVIQYFDYDCLRDELPSASDDRINKIIEQNPAWEFVFYVNCPVEDSLRIINLLKKYKCRFPVIMDPDGMWTTENYGYPPGYLRAGGVICDERGKLLGGGTIGTSVFFSSFLDANRVLGWRKHKRQSTE